MASTTAYSPLEERPIKNTIVLFDVDGTLSPARKSASPEMLAALAALRQKVAIGYVGGSDFSKQQEQLGSADRAVTSMFDFSFSENGLRAWKLGAELQSTQFIESVGEDQYKVLVKFILRYISELDIPVMRGTFVEFRRGMINVSPIGRNASADERSAFEHYSIGGQISFDIFPTGWDKTYCLRHLEDEAKKPGGIQFTTIHFFGDKTFEGGNDYEIYTDPRVTGHSVKNPDDTLRILKELFDV
ncbi:hypothetical protein ONZ43_g1659 [Nemania bipapillata]|uniref:Uncharacterized protein n=1 Tax=Nemania bipapillata TaxID=110536 RepID=A0ACC2J405_9PEZI|nr:hypothetical protein ONZ43_g1659 [Nemania bipapillata]